MGTTKLTRKEILAEDPVHEALLWLIEFFRANGSKIAVAVVAIAALAFGGYSGLQYLDNREDQAQARLGKGIDFFHADIAPDATNDPYSKGSTPTFRSDAAKYQAAAKEFSSIASGYGFGKMSVVARYFLGLSQLQLGQKNDAVQNLESVANNSKNRTLGFLAKRVLAIYYLNSGNNQRAREVLEGMIRDPQCDLQKEDLSIQLSRALAAQGKRDEAIKVLRDANSQDPSFGMFKQQLLAELDKLQKTPQTGVAEQPVHP